MEASASSKREHPRVPPSAAKITPPHTPRDQNQSVHVSSSCSACWAGPEPVSLPQMPEMEDSGHQAPSSGSVR